jgi:quercetin dioxygenase-like cupin family protein
VKIQTLVAGLAASICAVGPAFAAAPLMLKDVIGLPGKEVRVVIVDSAPGASSPVHRHNGQVFVYMLSGKMIMEVMGSPPVTVGPGDTFYENPDDIHTMSKNASDKDPARFVVFMIVNKGEAISTPVK